MKKIKKVALQALGLIVVFVLWLPFLILKRIADEIFVYFDELTSKIQRQIYK